MSLADIFRAIVNAFLGRSDAQTIEQTPIESKSTVNPVKTDKQMFYNYMLRGESYDTIDKLWMEALSKEQAGIYDYKLTGKLGWYHIKDGQLVGNGAVGK